MATTFSVVGNEFPDNIAMTTTATAIKTWLDGLSITITTVYGITIEHHAGFWKVIVIYV